jgi:hypothetical protein
VGLDDPPGQEKAHAQASGLARREGIKDSLAVRFRDAGPRVVDHDEDPAVPPLGPDLHGPALGRLDGVAQQVEQGLQEETPVPPDRQFRRGLASQPDPAAGRLLDERLAYYANLRQSEDEGDTESRGRFARYMMAATEAQGAWSWFLPELQTLPESFVASCLADPRFSDYAVFLRKVIRWKPHVLSDKEERLLALQAESAGTAQDAFSVLTNVDIDFGTVDTPEGPRPLSQSTYVSFMRHPDREIRRRAYEKFYAAYDGQIGRAHV